MNAKTNEPGRASRWLPVKPGVIFFTEFAGLTTGDLFLQERLQENTTGDPSQTRAVTGLQRYRRDRTCVARDRTCVKAGQNMRNFPLQSGTEHAWITFAANRLFHSTASHQSTMRLIRVLALYFVEPHEAHMASGAALFQWVWPLAAARPLLLSSGHPGTAF